MVSNLVRRNLAILVVALAVAASTAVCQTAPTAAPGNAPADQNAAAATDQATDGAAQDADTSNVTAPDTSTGVHALATGRFIDPNTPSPYHFGPISLLSTSLQQVYNTNSVSVGTGSSSTWGTLFQANIAVDLRILRRSRLVFQYQPQLMVVNGEFNSGLANHNADFNLLFPITQRMQVQFTDSLAHYSPRTRLFSTGGGMVTDVATNYVNQVDFVQRTTDTTTNSTRVAIMYNLSPRNQLTVSPIFGYVYNSGNSKSNWGRNAGASVSFTRNITPRTRIGGEYSFVSTSFGSDLPSSEYNAFGVNFETQFGRGWQVRGAALASTMLSANQQHWTPMPRVSIAKAFQRSSIVLAYSRTNMLGSSLHTGYADQVDLQYQRQIGRRLQMGIGGGDYGEILSGEGTNSRYGSANVSVMLMGGMSWSTSYLYITQNGNALTTLPGDRMIVRTGISWVPGTNH